MRSLIDVSGRISELGYKEDSHIEELLDEAERQIFAVTNAPIGQRFVSIRETLGEAWDRLESLHHKKDQLRGIPTGFKALDDHIAGLQKSDLIILAARPSMGKTALALDIARQAATQHNIPVGIFSLEMSSQQLVDRMLAAESHVDAWKLRTGKLTTDEEFSKIRDSLDKLAKAPIFIDDKPSNTVLGMRSTARRLKSEHGLGLIIVDYLQLMQTSKNYDSMVNQVTEISRSLKALARELEVPVLALSQLSRAVESRGGKPDSPTCAIPALLNKTRTWCSLFTARINIKKIPTSRISPRFLLRNTEMVLREKLNSILMLKKQRFLILRRANTPAPAKTLRHSNVNHESR